MTSRRAALRSSVVALVTALLGSLLVISPAPVLATASDFHLLLTGAAATAYEPPADLDLVDTWQMTDLGVTIKRYQQRAGNAQVDDAQVSIVSRDGSQVLVDGHYFQDPTATNHVVLTPTQAAAIARDRSVAVPTAATSSPRTSAPGMTRGTTLRLDGVRRLFYYLVETTAPGVRLFTQIDAATGAVLGEWNALQTADGVGTGVKGDRKSLTGAGLPGGIGALTKLVNGTWRLLSTDGNFITYDAGHQTRWYYPVWPAFSVLTDNKKSPWGNDNDWKAGYQKAAVDAQYYAALTVGFYADQLGFDYLSQCGGPIRSVVHYASGYANAFWDGYEMVYGDGDGYYIRAMSGGQDVVTHELSHAVTECRAPLDYVNQPGALNEAFSDMMATAAEWDYAEPLSSNCVLDGAQTGCPDWWLGEDVTIGGADHAFRNLAQPAIEGQPSYYADRYTGSSDSGGVHTNSGIANHAFYLMVHGGRNARCSGPTDSQADCDVVVPGIGMEHAQQITYLAWGMLTNSAKFCDARDATLAAADALYPESFADRAAAELAWRAVGVSSCVAPGFAVKPAAGAPRSVAAKPGATVHLQLSVVRNGSTAPVDLTAQSNAPAVETFSPTANLVSPTSTSELDISVDSGAASGVYPILVTATDGTHTHSTALSLLVDNVPPTTSVDRVGLAEGGQVGTDGTSKLDVEWSATDDVAGVASGSLQDSPDGSAWTPIASAPNGSISYSAAPGSHSFKSTATDVAGNTSELAVLGVVLTGSQETAAAYAGGGWSTLSGAADWGTTRFSKRRGATATFNFNGSGVAWVAPKAPKRGKARVFIDGVRVALVDLYATSFSDRRVVFATDGLAVGPHTLKIRVKHTSGRPRVDVDGFLVLG